MGALHFCIHLLVAKVNMWVRPVAVRTLRDESLDDGGVGIILTGRCHRLEQYM